MKCQILFSGKNKKILIWSAEFALRGVKDKSHVYFTNYQHCFYLLWKNILTGACSWIILLLFVPVNSRARILHPSASWILGIYNSYIIIFSDFLKC